jgi:DNA-binding HxlR family transcriptional regulator
MSVTLCDNNNSSNNGCPIRDLLDRLGDKWSLLVIKKLSEAPQNKRRFSDLMRAIDGISQRMLTATLRHLERDGLVTREVFAEIPPRVEYQLTEQGKSLLVPVRTLIDWVEANWPAMQAARDAYDNKGKVTKFPVKAA